ncbi:hypothetical protein CF319_g640 [Tilletia indica]|nr:hypothetical protein CF319_g640 [Tilletia indica]
MYRGLPAWLVGKGEYAVSQSWDLVDASLKPLFSGIDTDLDFDTAQALLFYATIYWDVRAWLVGKEGIDTNLDLDTAQALLFHAQNIPVCYGAVMHSFLGVMHWGFQFSKFGGTTAVTSSVSPSLCHGRLCS